MNLAEFNQKIKPRLFQIPVLQDAWGAFRRWQLHRDYAARRDWYAAQAQAQKLIYRETDVTASIRARLAQQGRTPAPRRMGEIHTFAFVPHIGWHHHLLSDLQEMGPLTVFDYVQCGIQLDVLLKADQVTYSTRQTMNEQMFSELKAIHIKHPVDWMFVYASGLEISANTVRRIQEELGIPTVNMCLDDKQSWTGPWMGDHRAGQIDIADCFDLSWTSARVACLWYLVEGGRPIYLPEGFNQSAYHPLPVQPDIPVSFIGAAYGFRSSVIRHLKRHGVEVKTFGAGWKNSGWVADMAEIYNRSQINLGMGGIGYSESLTNLKGRDFEVPGTGGGIYLTTFNPDLAQHFVIGQEIACYHNRDEIIELIQYYLAHPEEAQAMARRARARCLAEHRWLHRYQRIGQILGILPELPSALEVNLNS